MSTGDVRIFINLIIYPLKYFLPFLTSCLISSASAQINHASTSGSFVPYEVCIEPASKSVKKYIRNFNSDSKANFENRQTIPEQVSIQNGFYRIRLTSVLPLQGESLNIRKVHQKENSNEEVRSLLPKNYYRMEQPNEKTIELYFSVGANTFFAESPGFLIISGLTGLSKEKMPDLLIGTIPYFNSASKNKLKKLQLLVSQ